MLTDIVLVAVPLDLGMQHEAVYYTTFINTTEGMEYLCQCTKIIIIFCKQIQTARY